MYGIHSAGSRLRVGASSDGATPVPIPNTAVKPISADGTASARLWDSRPAPTQRREQCEKMRQTQSGLFCVVVGVSVILCLSS